MFGQVEVSNREILDGVAAGEQEIVELLSRPWRGSAEHRWPDEARELSFDRFREGERTVCLASRLSAA